MAQIRHLHPFLLDDDAENDNYDEAKKVTNNFKKKITHDVVFGLIPCLQSFQESKDLERF